MRLKDIFGFFLIRPEHIHFWEDDVRDDATTNHGFKPIETFKKALLQLSSMVKVVGIFKYCAHNNTFDGMGSDGFEVRLAKSDEILDAYYNKF